MKSKLKQGFFVFIVLLAVSIALLKLFEKKIITSNSLSLFFAVVLFVYSLVMLINLIVIWRLSAQRDNKENIFNVLFTVLISGLSFSYYEGLL